MNALRLSVIVPVRNGSACVGALLDSLSAQTTVGLAGCEFIAVDDASDDATPEILARYPWLRVVRHEARRGAGAARNSGARAAAGDVLIFLDADTRLRDPDFLVRCAAFLAAHPDYAALSGCYYDRNPGSRGFARYLDACEAAMRAAALDRPAPGSLSGCVCALRKTAFDAVGGFSEDPRVVLEDPDIGCRLSVAGYRHWLSGELRVEHRQPGLGHYLKELLPRTRHYLHLLRHYGAYNEGMGGRREGWGRGVLALGLLMLTAGGFFPALAYGGLLLLGAATWLNRGLVAQLLKQESLAFLPLAGLFHAVTSVAIAAGGTLGLLDALRYALRRRLSDVAVLLAYLRSLAAPRAGGYLIHFLTHRCNAACAHCFDHPQRQRIAREDELDLSRIRRVAASAGPLGHVSLTGGEPLLRDDIAAVVAAYYDAGVRSFSLSSNGSYPQRLAELLPKLCAAAPLGRIIVTLSLDGVGDSHDRLRGLPGLYEKVERSLAVLCEARRWHPQIRAHVCVTLSQANAADLDRIWARLKTFRLDQVELNRLRGVPAAGDLQGVGNAVYAAASAQVGLVNGAARGLARLFAGLDRAMFAMVRQPDRAWPCGNCLAGRRLAVILADGEVLPCEMLRSVRPEDAAAYDDFSLGRLDAYGNDLGALLASPQARRISDYIRDSRCRCSFECAIFATMAYRPWSLWRVFGTAPVNAAENPGLSGSDAQPVPVRR